MNSAEELFIQLTSNADTRVKTSFDHIKIACDNILMCRGQLTYSAVGKWCEKKFAKTDANHNIVKVGTPTVKTIQQNRFNYKSYIDFRKSESQKGKFNFDRGNNNSDKNNRSDNLDHATKLHISNLEAEISRLRRALRTADSMLLATQKENPLELSKLFAQRDTDQDLTTMDCLKKHRYSTPFISEEANGALKFLLFDLDKTGIVTRFPRNDREPQSTWVNTLTEKPLLDILQYLALRDFWESIQEHLRQYHDGPTNNKC